ncbi:MAG TPA: D-amino acid dehydrogenase [Rickettsiales bacterium]|nr:D-amino acid dehydrogenase [Rickettsiales bacterium]
MKIVILGAGVIGVSAAYFLGSRGHEVEVIERNGASSMETSFANGGQLSFSHAEPWANPAVFAKIAKWMFKDDAPLVLRPRADLDMLDWGLRFLFNCSEPRANANSVNILRLGLYSKKKMEWLRSFTGIKFDNIREGILHVFTQEKDFEGAVKQAKFQDKFGCPSEIASHKKCLQIEPALEHAGRPILGGIFQPLDESGDVFTFTQELAKLCEKEHKTVFHYNTTLKSINQSGGKITSVTTDKGDITADAYIVSLGSYSSLYLKPIGIKVPIYPMKGYSITFPVNHYTPTVSLTDTENKIVYSRLGNRLRIAGTAEFAGHNTTIRAERIAPIVNAVRSLLPKCEYGAPESQWACLRPSTPDGPPIIGKTKYSNLYMNTGHGTLGWTQAAGSAALIADIIENRETEISLEGMGVDRYW